MNAKAFVLKDIREAAGIAQTREWFGETAKLKGTEHKVKYV